MGDVDADDHLITEGAVTNISSSTATAEIASTTNTTTTTNKTIATTTTANKVGKHVRFASISSTGSDENDMYNYKPTTDSNKLNVYSYSPANDELKSYNYSSTTGCFTANDEQHSSNYSITTNNHTSTNDYTSTNDCTWKTDDKLDQYSYCFVYDDKSNSYSYNSPSYYPSSSSLHDISGDTSSYNKNDSLLDKYLSSENDSADIAAFLANYVAPASTSTPTTTTSTDVCDFVTPASTSTPSTTTTSAPPVSTTTTTSSSSDNFKGVDFSHQSASTNQRTWFKLMPSDDQEPCETTTSETFETIIQSPTPTPTTTTTADSFEPCETTVLQPTITTEISGTESSETFETTTLEPKTTIENFEPFEISTEISETQVKPPEAEKSVTAFEFTVSENFHRQITPKKNQESYTAFQSKKTELDTELQLNKTEPYTEFQSMKNELDTEFKPNKNEEDTRQDTGKNDDLQALFQRVLAKTMSLKNSLDDEKQTISSLEVSLVEEKSRNENLKDCVDELCVERSERRKKFSNNHFYIG